jgi:hypothetical protein
MTVENTGRRDPMLHLIGAMSDGSSDYITNMEAAGQRQLVSSELIPTKAPDAELTALGFTLGGPVDGDPLFRHATLPAGWTREGSSHAMWSYIVDQHGRRRVAIFYKAAYYDRKAAAHVETSVSYLRDVLYEGLDPVLDDEWLTREVAADVLRSLAKQSRDEAAEAREFAAGRGDRGYWTKRAAECDAEVVKADALRVRIERSIR